MSSIEWTDATWNPIIGCSRISPGCDHCYAIRVATRFQNSHAHYVGTAVGLDWTGRINIAPPHIFDKPLKTRKPTVWFVNSMSDLFHDGVPDAVICAVFKIMNQTPRHEYQLLTKRPQRALKKARELGLRFTPNIWMGATIEEDKYAKARSRALAAMKREFRIETIFVSAEPLLSDLPSLPVEEIDWLIVGGESGNQATVRPMEPQWARNLCDRCRATGVPFFFKQWGAFGQDGVRRSKAENGHLLDGEELFEMPISIYDRLPSPDPKWVRGGGCLPVLDSDGNLPLLGAASRPGERHEVSGFHWLADGQPTNDYVEAVRARLAEEEVLENSNFKAPLGEVNRVRKALPLTPTEPIEIARVTELRETDVIRFCRLLVQSGEAIEHRVPLRFEAVDLSFVRLVSHN